ncbi:MAG: sugar ABC transporter permease [Oscillibacter sp.]|nr:sugar ABC transporter permease [Oscillibacter sp.]
MTKWGKTVYEFKRDWQLHLMMLVPVIWLAIFKYWPMYGVQIAFRNYKTKLGITGSEWVGWRWFEKFLTSPKFFGILKNTLIISFYSLIIHFILAVALALLINAIRNEKFKKFTQTIVYIPHFISIVILVAMMNQIFNPISGLYGTLYRVLGNEGYPTDFRALASSFRHMYVWSGVWQNIGWETIIYVAALAGVSKDLHEAARIDGATRWKRVLNVDFPTLLPTACIMLIMKFGHVMTVGYEKVYLMQSQLNLNTSEVISTYVYKMATGGGGDFSYGAAIGLFNAVINCLMLLFVNWLTKRLSGGENSLF